MNLSIRIPPASLRLTIATAALFAASARASESPPWTVEATGVATVQLKQRYSLSRPRADRIGQRSRYGFVANDPLYGSQWHLQNTGGGDAHLQGAWNQGYSGSGVTIGFVDDGLQWDHPDLYENYSAPNSYNFGSIVPDSDPSPVYANSGLGAGDGDNHGTAVAGVAAARGGNGQGGTGAAPLASIAGLRVDFLNFYHDNQFAAATRHLSTANASPIDIKNHSYGISVPYVDTPDEVAALADSTAAGTIHVYAAGNERAGFGDGDANKKAEQNSVNSLAVGALAHTGFFSPYSNWGANLFVTAPSSGLGVGVTTADRTGTGLSGGYNDAVGDAIDFDSLPDLDYTSAFGGTSSAAPLVAGVLALAKQANPNLDLRMAKHLLVQTSDSSIDAFDASETSDGGWKTNAAGNRFNQNYGFGLIDANALTRAASRYVGVTEAAYQSVSATINESLPDAVVGGSGPGSLATTFDLFEPGELEEMLIELDVTHSYTGDLQATLVSPSGTSSRLMMRNIADPYSDLNWTFATNSFWGENPAGTWTLTLEDWFGLDVGRWNSFSATAITGSLIAIPEPSAVPLLLLSLAVPLLNSGCR